MSPLGHLEDEVQRLLPARLLVLLDRGGLHLEEPGGEILERLGGVPGIRAGQVRLDGKAHCLVSFQLMRGFGLAWS
jgi:hypothetical protein